MRVALLLLIASVASAQRLTTNRCIDYRGLPVLSLANPTITDVAVATMLHDGRPVIYFNPHLMQHIHPKTRLFFHAHECGHHAMGHLPQLAAARQRPAFASAIEQQADCFGIRALVDARQANDHDIAIVQRDLARLGVGDWDHLPGPMRAINLRKCLGGHPFNLLR